MGGSGQRYGRNGAHLTEEEIKRRHRSADSDAYMFDVEYEKLKKEEERLQAEYEREREKYLRITEQLRQEMSNGTASDADMARYMAMLTDRGVQLQQQQQKMQENIDKLNEDRADVQNQMNELRMNAFAGSTNAYQSADRREDYNGFKSDSERGTAKVVEMSPEEFLRRATFGENGKGSLQSLLSSMRPSDIEKYMRQMLRGTKYNTPSITAGGNSSNISNARVLAALLNGYHKIPVMVIE